MPKENGHSRNRLLFTRAANSFRATIMCQMLGQLLHVCIHSLYLKPYILGTIISPVVQVRELRLRKIMVEDRIMAYSNMSTSESLGPATMLSYQENYTFQMIKIKDFGMAWDGMEWERLSWLIWVGPSSSLKSLKEEAPFLAVVREPDVMMEEGLERYKIMSLKMEEGCHESKNAGIL